MILVTSCTRKDLVKARKSLELLQAKAQFGVEMSEFAGTSQEVAMYSAIVEAVKPLRRKILDAVRYLEQEAKRYEKIRKRVSAV